MVQKRLMNRLSAVAMAVLLTTGLTACNSSLIERVGQRLGFGSGGNTANNVTPVPIDLPPQTQAHLRDYDTAVESLKQFYRDADKVGKRWQDLAAQNRDKIAQGVDDTTFVQLMGEVLAAVQDEDVVLLPPAAPVQTTTPLTATYSGIGVLVGLPEQGKDRLLALYVYPNSPAERAGVRSHDSIVAIDGEAVTYDARATLVSRLRGEVGSKVVLTVRTPGQAERDVTVTRRPVQPNSPMTYEFVPGTNIAYIAPNPTNLDAMRDDTADAMRDLLNTQQIDGLVLDLRVIRGAEFPMAEMLGLFVNGKVANLQLRNVKNTLEITGKSIAGSQDVPMVILVSHNTQGQAVAFAGIMQSLGRARIVGEQTQARVSVLNTINLPNLGARLQIPTGDYLSLKNVNWYEGGVQPDNQADKSWEDITADDDTQLNQAVDILLGRN